MLTDAVDHARSVRGVWPWRTLEARVAELNWEYVRRVRFGVDDEDSAAWVGPALRAEKRPGHFPLASASLGINHGVERHERFRFCDSGSDGIGDAAKDVDVLFIEPDVQATIAKGGDERRHARDVCVCVAEEDVEHGRSRSSVLHAGELFWRSLFSVFLSQSR